MCTEIDVEETRARIIAGAPPPEFRRALEAVPPLERERWIDALFGIDKLPADADLPPGCVPYLPCALECVLEALHAAQVGPSDTFVDVGAGIGRVAMLVHLLSGARTVGIEIQARMVHEARALAERLSRPEVSMVHKDASEVPMPADASVVFLYCPFDAERVARVVDGLAGHRGARLVCVDTSPPRRPWLESLAQGQTLSVHRIGVT